MLGELNSILGLVTTIIVVITGAHGIYVLYQKTGHRGQTITISKKMNKTYFVLISFLGMHTVDERDRPKSKRCGQV